jgi:hypothetical protein
VLFQNAFCKTRLTRQQRCQTTIYASKQIYACFIYAYITDIIWTCPLGHTDSNFLLIVKSLPHPIVPFFNNPVGLSWPWSYGSWIYNYLCNQCLSSLMLWVRISIRARCTTLCDNVYQWIATGRGFSPGTLVSSTNKTDHHDITEILLKVALNTIKQTVLFCLHMKSFSERLFPYGSYCWRCIKCVTLMHLPNTVQCTCVVYHWKDKYKFFNQQQVVNW